MMKCNVKICLQKLSIPFFALSMLINSSAVPVAADTYEHLSLYVSAGSTNGDGSVTNPFGTVTEARDYIRTLKANGQYPENGITVNLREGIYEIKETISLNREDAGTENGPVTYGAYLDEDVVFTGGLSIPLTSFSKVTDTAITSRLSSMASKAVVQYDLYANGITREMIGELELTGAASINHLSQFYNDYTTTPCAKLFFEDEEMTIARWPNSGFAELGDIEDKGDITRNWMDDRKGTAEYVPESERPDYPRGFTFKISADKAKLWQNAPDGRIYGFFTYSWYDGSDNIKSINTQENTLTTQRDCSYGAVAGQEYYVYNILEEMDSPGEYYIDRDTGILYFYPPAASGTCVISIINQPMFTLTEGADNIRIKNITMSCGRKSAVSAYGANNIGVEGCTINNMTSTGIDIKQAYNSHISNCHIYNVGEHAMFLSGPNDYDTLKPSGNFAENNWCHDWGQKIVTYSGAIRAAGIGVRVSNNKFNSANHLAVNLYGNDNLVEYNDISDVLKTSADSGAIYTGKSWVQRGLVIRNNYIHDINTNQDGEVYGVYLDDFYCGATVTGNIFENLSGGSDTAGFVGGGRDTTVTNNIFINTNAATGMLDSTLRYTKTSEDALKSYNEGRAQQWDATNGYGLYNDFFSEEVYSKYPNIMDYDENDTASNVNMKHSVIKNNVVWNCKHDRLYRAAAYGSGLGITDKILDEYMISIGNDINDSYKTDNDPGFVDYYGGDYRLKEDSEVYNKLDDFNAPDVENMGLYTLRLKNKLGNSISIKVNSPLSFVNFKYNMIDEANTDVVPVVINDRTMVPVRYIAETLGGTAEWDDATQCATIKVGEKELLIDGNTKTMTLDGEVLESDVEPRNLNGRFLVPLRVISESFGKTVEWHDGGLIIIGDGDKYFDTENYADTLMIGEMLRRLSY